MRKIVVVALAALAVVAATARARAAGRQDAAHPDPIVADRSVAPPAAPFDPVAATEEYLARVPPEKRAQSDAYFEGGYWLQLWGFLYAAGVAWLLLETRLSAGMRDRAVRLSRFRALQPALYWV